MNLRSGFASRLDSTVSISRFTFVNWIELLLPVAYWSTVFSHPTSSCECGTMCTLMAPRTTPRERVLRRAEAPAAASAAATSAAERRIAATADAGGWREKGARGRG